jgi:hypothetical protein
MSIQNKSIENFNQPTEEEKKRLKELQDARKEIMVKKIEKKKKSYDIFRYIVLTILISFIGIILFYRLKDFFKVNNKLNEAEQLAYILTILISIIILSFKYFTNKIKNLQEIINDINDNKIINNNNELVKNKHLEKLNKFFKKFNDEISFIDNKYNYIIENNSKNITEIIDLLYNKNNNLYLNYIGNTDTESNLDFYTKMRTIKYSTGNLAELKDTYLYKNFIKLIFHKIYLYNIHQKEFLKEIYYYFDNIDIESQADITLSRTELINNYKILTNIIYNEYNNAEFDSTKYIQKNKKGFINNLKFSKILDNYSQENINNTNISIKDNYDNITSIKTEFKHLITKDIKDSKHKEEIYKHIIIILGAFFIIFLLKKGVIFYYNEEKEDILTRFIEFIKILAIIGFIFIIFYTKFRKYSIKVEFDENSYHYNEKILDNLLYWSGNDVPEKSLNYLFIKLKIINYLIQNKSTFSETTTETDPFFNGKSKVETFIIKYLADYFGININDDNNQEINRIVTNFITNDANKFTIFNKYKIISISNNNEDKDDNEIDYNYYYDSDANLFLNEEELKYTVISEIYEQYIKIIKHYDCCSYLKKIEQKAVFPWEEIAIYIILFMIFAYVLGKILEEKSSLNIFRQFSKLSKTKEQLGLHDKEENVLVDKDIVINIIIIYVLSFYIYRIYNGYLDYYKQFNIKNVDDTR